MALNLFDNSLFTPLATTAPATPTTVATTTPIQPSQEVLSAYQTLFGREADTPGALGWTQSGLTGQALLDAMARSAQGTDVEALKNYQTNLINQTYQSAFGRTAEEEGLQNWLNSGLTGQSLTDAIKAGARGSDIGALYGTNDLDISSNLTNQALQEYISKGTDDPYALYTTAQKYNVDPETLAGALGVQRDPFVKDFGLASLVGQEYSDIGRGVTGKQAIDQAGFNEWYRQLQTGAITPEQFEKAFLSGALGTVNQGLADQNVTSRTVAEAIAKGYGGIDLLNKANPLDVYEAIRREGKSVESLSQLYPNLNPQQINDYLSKVPDAYAQNVDQTLSNILGANFAASMDPTQKQALVDKLVTGELTRDSLTDMFANSEANKKQEALRIANSYMSMYGGSQDDAAALYAKLMGLDYTGPGKISNDVLSSARSIFDTSLMDEKGGFEQLIRQAATREGAENTEFFKANPNALLIYDDLEVRSDDPFAKYGEINGAPIYDAAAVDKFMTALGGADVDSVSGFAHRDTRKLGIDPGGIIDGGSAFIKRGAAVFGLEKTPEYTYGGEEQVPTGRYNISGDVAGVAAKFGINPNAYKDIYKTVQTTDENGNVYNEQVLEKTAAEQIYDAINERANDLYVIGNVNPDNLNDKSQDNFMYTAYKRTEDGKLIPVNTPTLYTGAINPDVYQKKGVFGGGWLGDFAQGIASIPFVAELALLSGNPYAYAAAKAAQTAAFTTDVGDIAKSGAIAYASQNLLPDVAKNISSGLGSAGITNPIVNQMLTQGTISGGVSSLLGGSGTEGFTSGAISGGITGGLNMANKELQTFAVKDLGVDPKFANVFANTLTSLAPTILTGGKIDPTKVLMNYMLNAAIKEARTNTNTNRNTSNTGATQSADSGITSLMASDTNNIAGAEGLYPEDVQAWIDEAESEAGKRYRASIAARYGLTQNPVPDSEFEPTGYRNGTSTMGYNPNIAAYMIEQGDNMIARPDENANLTGFGALKQRMGSEYLPI